jgi:hypothetical protein
MCNPDMSIITMRWGHLQPSSLANWTFPHTCRSWDAIEDWGSQRYVERLFEPGWLNHPTLGELFFQDPVLKVDLRCRACLRKLLSAGRGA